MSKEKQNKLETYSSTLKRRSSEVEEVKIVNKPRKMNLVKPKRIPAKINDYANSALLVFPTDSLGVTTELKAALIRAGSKIGKDKAALALVEEVLSIGVKHIHARFEQNTVSQGLKRRVDTSPVEEEKDAETGSSGSVTPSYDDMLSALKEADVKPKSRKKEDVEQAYNELTKYEQDEEGEE